MQCKPFSIVNVCLRIVSLLILHNLAPTFHHFVAKWRLGDFFNFEPCYRVAMTACLDLPDHVYYKRYRWLIIAQYPWWMLDGHSITILISGHHNYYNSWSPSMFSDTRSVVNPDLELRGREGLIYLLCWLFSIFFLFLPKIRGGGSPRSPTTRDWHLLNISINTSLTVVGP